MSTRGEVLVAILNNKLDFNLVYTYHWYRIPAHVKEKWFKDCWPPTWLAFYQTKVFHTRGHAINYYAKVADIRYVPRQQLFPNEPANPKSNRWYYQLFLHPLQQLPQPILSRRLRRITFIPTTEEKFFNATEINDLYDDSPLEDKLWVELKLLQIQAERQELVTVNNQSYLLDFAIYCVKGNINVETDGDSYHEGRAKTTEDNLRNNALTAAGWTVLRYNTPQIKESLTSYCIPNIVETINTLDGLEEGNVLPRKIDLNMPKGVRQLGLFDELP